VSPYAESIGILAADLQAHILIGVLIAVGLFVLAIGSLFRIK